jgi:hypothetical protein
METDKLLVDEAEVQSRFFLMWFLSRLDLRLLKRRNSTATCVTGYLRPSNFYSSENIFSPYDVNKNPINLSRKNL